MAGPGRSASAWPLLAGIVLGALGAAWAKGRRRRLDPRILRALPRALDPPMVVFVPGILRQPAPAARRERGVAEPRQHPRPSRPLPPATAAVRAQPRRPAPRLPGRDRQRSCRGRSGSPSTPTSSTCSTPRATSRGVGPGLRYAVYTYDWRRDLVESARGLALRLEGLAREKGDPAARFHLVGHSMGGLVARYYLRYGDAEPPSARPVTWAGARRMASVVLAATPNAGCTPGARRDPGRRARRASPTRRSRPRS